MKRLLITVVLILILFSGCGLIHPKYVPVESKKDSIYIETLIERVDTVRVDVPGERVFVIRKDSSRLETAVAVSYAEIDSIGFLHHTLENKKVSLEKEVVFKDRVIEKKVEVEKEVPVEVEVKVPFVPGYYKWINIIFWLCVGLFVIFIVLKVHFRFKV